MGSRTQEQELDRVFHSQQREGEKDCCEWEELHGTGRKREVMIRLGA